VVTAASIKACEFYLPHHGVVYYPLYDAHAVACVIVEPIRYSPGGGYATYVVMGEMPEPIQRLVATVDLIGKPASAGGRIMVGAGTVAGFRVLRDHCSWTPRQAVIKIAPTLCGLTIEQFFEEDPSCQMS
jgi:hypothetical protein